MCDQRLQQIAHAAIELADFTVITGFRSQAQQDEAVANGRSQTPWPTSKHNAMPALAMDLAPYPIDWNDIPAFEALASIVKRCASDLGIPITWGGDWTHLRDFPHFELTDPWPKPEGG